jgi:hypothetical protein
MSTASSVRSRKTGTPSLFPKDTKEQDVAPPTLPELPEVPYTPAFISQSQMFVPSYPRSLVRLIARELTACSLPVAMLSSS